MASGQEMMAEAEEVVDRAMSQKKSLGLPRRFEPPPLAFPLTRRLM